MGESTLARGMLIRALAFGIVLGGVAFAGATLALSTTTAETDAVAAVIATLMVSLGMGVWAGAPQGDRAPDRLSQRWITAAAFVAVAGSFSPFLESYRQLLPGPWWLFGGLILGVAIPAYTLGMVPPELLHWGRRSWDDELDAGWAPLGTMSRGMLAGLPLGVLLTGLLALPSLGPGPVLVACALILLVAMALPQPSATRSIERVLYDGVSPFGHLLVTEVAYPGERQPERRLYLNGEEESGELVRSGAPTLGYIAAAERWLSASTPVASRYLFLGGGAYTLPRRIAERDPRADVVVVELDPDVTRIAYRYFGLEPAHRIQTINGDARAFLDRTDDASFDRIYIDVYGGTEELPHSLVTQEAVRAMSGRLNTGGIAAINLIGTVVGEEQRPLWSMIRTFATVFTNVAVYLHLGRDYPERQNLLLVGSMESASFPTSAGGFALWPQDEWPSVEGVITYHDIAPALPVPGDGIPRRDAIHFRERSG